MSHVIVVYNADASFSPRGLYADGWAVSSAGAWFGSLDDAIDTASSASSRFGSNGDNSTRYAVHRWLGPDTGPESCELPIPFWLSSAVYVPEGSRDLPQAMADIAATWAGDPSAALISAAALAGAKPLPEPVTNIPGASVPADRFEVRSGLVGTDRDNWGTVAEFDTGKAAGAWVAERKAEYAANGKSLCIVKIAASDLPAVDWREREQERMDDGTYTLLPNVWHSRVMRCHPDHFAHVASSDKRKVAFTESASSGERDRQKVLSASVYAERYLSDWYGSGSRAEFIADMCGDSIQVAMAPMGDVGAMVWCYRDAERWDLSSCMSHGVDSYGSHIHPVSVYAMGGQITFAMLRQADAEAEGSDDSSGFDDAWNGEGRMLARCLVFDDGNGRKEFGRIYSNGDGMSRLLKTGLEAQGFCEGDFDGARVGKVLAKGRDPYVYVMPYLDVAGGSFDDGGDCFILTGSGPYGGGSTAGLAHATPMVACDRCDDSVPETHTGAVYMSADDDCGETWCHHCRGNYASMVDDWDGEGTSGYIPDDNVATYVAGSGPSWRSGQHVADWLLHDGTLEALEIDGVWYADAFVCEDCGETFRAADRDSEHVDCCEGCGDERRDAAQGELDLDAAA